MLAVFDSKKKVNAIHLNLAKKLVLPINLIDVGSQKIDGTILDIYEMVVITFSITNKANWVRFVEEIFFIANVNLKVVFRILFLTLSSIDINFQYQKL